MIVVRPLMSSFGQYGTVRCAAVINGLVGGALISSMRLKRKQAVSGKTEAVEMRVAEDTVPLLPFGLALSCAAFCGFAALSYEIIWYRLLAFALEDKAPTFASLLGSYLIGIAMGSRFAEGYTERHPVRDAVRILPLTILGSAVVSFCINPVSALLLRINWVVGSPGGVLSWFLFLVLICHAAMLFGALFPLTAYVAVSPGIGTGRAVSYLYASNIVGSTLGVLLVGFVLMDRFSLYQMASIILVGGVLYASGVLLATGRGAARGLVFAGSLIAAILMIPFSGPIFSTIYDRLLFKTLYPARHFSEVIENHSGMIGITPEGTLYGGGVYVRTIQYGLAERYEYDRPAFCHQCVPSQSRSCLAGGTGFRFLGASTREQPRA
jgi:hypothetical protein